MDPQQSNSQDFSQAESHVSLICGLPDEIALLCLARVPRMYHHVLRCVSKKWRDLLCSDEWHSCRQKHNLEETWIYILCKASSKGNLCFVLDPDPANRSWKFQQFIPLPCTKKDGILLETLGKKLYLMGGCSWKEDATDEVHCYDASTNQWSIAPSLPTARCFFVSASMNNKLYVTSGLGLNSDAPNSWDIYDSHSNNWSSHKNHLLNADIVKFIAFNEKLYTIHKTWSGLHYAGVYDPPSRTWQGAEEDLALCSCGPTVVVDGTLYMLDESSGTRLMMWKEDTKEWLVLGRLSHHLTRPPCQLVAIGRFIFVIGQGPSIVVIDIDKAIRAGRMLVSFSFSPKFDCDYTVISCSTITL